MSAPRKPSRDIYRAITKQLLGSEASRSRQAQALADLGRRHAALSRHTLESLRDVLQDVSRYADHDSILGELIDAHQSECTRGAFEILLAVMFPLLSSFYRRRSARRPSDRGDEEWERVLDAFTHVIDNFPRSRLGSVEGNLKAEIAKRLVESDCQSLLIESALRNNVQLERAEMEPASEAADVSRPDEPDINELLAGYLRRGLIDRGEEALLLALYRDGKTSEGLANDLGISLDTLKKRKREALRRMRSGRLKRIRAGSQSSQTSPSRHIEGEQEDTSGDDIDSSPVTPRRDSHSLPARRGNDDDTTS